MILPRLLIAFHLPLVCLSLAAAAEPAQRPADRLAGLGDNTWVYLDPQPSKRLVLESRDPSSTVREIISPEPAFREYTSAQFGDGKLFYFGGGHSGYFGNDVEVFDPAENTWRQCTRPHCPPRDDTTYFSGGSERSYVDPDTGDAEPFVIHGYARTGYDSGSHRYLCTAMFPTKTARDPADNKWKLVSQAFGLIAFDPKTVRWEFLARTPPQLESGMTGLAYDPDLGGVLGFGPGTVLLYADSKWTPYANPALSLVASGGAASVYVPAQKTHLLAVLGHGGASEQGRLAAFSTQTRQATGIESMPAELRGRVGPGTGAFNLVMAYDSGQKKTIVMSTGADQRPDVWTYDLATDRWEQLPTATTAPKLIGPFEPGRGRAPLVYDPIHNVFFLLARHGETAETWAYRYKDGAK
jgi:hypothetical protein